MQDHSGLSGTQQQLPLIIGVAELNRTAKELANFTGPDVTGTRRNA